MIKMSEVAQQEAARVQGRVQAAMENLLAAKRAAGRLVVLGGPNYNGPIETALNTVTPLSLYIATDVGPVEAHRGLRVEHNCSDPDCPAYRK